MEYEGSSRATESSHSYPSLLALESLDSTPSSTQPSAISSGDTEIWLRRFHSTTPVLLLVGEASPPAYPSDSEATGLLHLTMAF
jgi:hypothetical protein